MKRGRRLFSLSNGIQSWEADGTLEEQGQDTQNGCSGGCFFKQAAFRLSGLPQQQGDSCPSFINEAYVAVGDVLLCHLC